MQYPVVYLQKANQFRLRIVWIILLSVVLTACSFGGNNGSTDPGRVIINNAGGTVNPTPNVSPTSDLFLPSNP